MDTIATDLSDVTVVSPGREPVTDTTETDDRSKVTTLSPGGIPARELRAALPETEWEPKTGWRAGSLGAETAAGERAEPASTAITGAAPDHFYGLKKCPHNCPNITC